MSLLKEIKRISNCINFVVREIRKSKKGFFAFTVLSIVVGVAIPLVLVRIPGSIVDCLMTGNFKVALLFALTFCATVFLGGVLNDGIKRRKIPFEERIRGHFVEKVGAHLMKIDCQRLEMSETLNEYQFAITSIDEKKTTKIIEETEKICSSLFTMVGLLYILRELNVIVILLLVLVVAANAFGESFRMRHIYERHKTETPAQRQLLYARNELAKKEYAKEIRIFGLLGYVTHKVEFYAQQMCNLWRSAAIKSIKSVAWTYILQGVQLSAAYIYLARGVISGTISVADFTVYSTAVTVFGMSSILLVNGLVSVVDTTKYLQSLRNFLDIPIPKNQKNSMPEEPITIRFEDVSYCYPNREEYALSHINLTIEPDVKYAVVGENGAGKTTFIKLLMGLYKPTGGRITVNGIDLTNIDMDCYRKHFATVFQDFHILGFGLDENIAMSDDVDIELMRYAIEGMGLEEAVEHLPEKEKTCMSTAYSPSGVDFSGGQKQKLAISRALYKNAQYIILDEPTAALSPQSEFDLYRSFQKISREKGVVYISHRFASCRLCDDIFVFSKGGIIERGNHEELMALNGHYRYMFEQQAELYVNHGTDGVCV
ncbi:MAG: ABC transporter ATP-binding protein [Clostridia bacterium]|nr:ABC transporter ATP-binding protein [Clostridia bacterium]MDD3092977.1 ABC transporter ATP-binding protein [Clostridia bacterium]MDD3971840.1 ABC transporter ATP-binding protein [Clostridia bacterium]MDD4542530.1 ABC transporter ATP-binding protein [Clostridia bacterium]NLB80676.1 ABC transporter ATP-binding protein [Clostridiaceae bacterium]